MRFIRSKRHYVDIYDKNDDKQADRYDMIYPDIIILYPIDRHFDRSKDPGDLEELPVHITRKLANRFHQFLRFVAFLCNQILSLSFSEVTFIFRSMINGII